jgi:hypothetical protein
MGKLRDVPIDAAKVIINNDRNKEYGDPAENMKDIAQMMSVILRPALKEDAEIRPEQVAMCMIAVKLSRMTTSPKKLDSWTDIAGYVGVGYEAMKINEAMEIVDLRIADSDKAAEVNDGVEHS